MFKNITKLILNNKTTISTIAISNKQTTRLFCTRYTREHEWARSDGNNKYTMGITDFAQRQLGDIVFVESPSINKTFSNGEPIGVVESVKAAADIFAPFDLKITVINELTNDEPELLNTDPMGEGWICKFESSKTDDFKKLLTEAEYKKYIEEGDQ